MGVGRPNPLGEEREVVTPPPQILWVGLNSAGIERRHAKGVSDPWESGATLVAMCMKSLRRFAWSGKRVAR